MADITTIEFGKNLRPSTVEAIKKINEVITALNKVDSSAIDTLKSQVGNLQSSITKLTSDVTTANDNITTLQSTTQSHTTDIDKIKVTLYTPLSAEDAEV